MAPPGTNVLAYDIRAGEFVGLKEPVDYVQVYGDVAIGLGPRHKVYVYTTTDRAWTEFRGQSDHTEIVGGDALITDLSGDTWLYKRGQKRLLRRPRAELNFASSGDRARR